MNVKTRAYLLIGLLAVSWGTIPLIIRTSGVSSLSLVGIRTFLGSIFLFAFLIRDNKVNKELFLSGFILGPLLAVHWSTMFLSIELNSVAIGIGLVFTYPIFIVIIEFLRGNKVSLQQNLIILIGFFGLYLLLDLEQVSSSLGVVYGLISALTLSILVIYGSTKTQKYGGLNVAFIQVFFAAIFLSPFTVQGFSWLQNNLLISMFLGFFLTGVGLVTYWYVVRIVSPVSIGTITYLEPVTGVLIGTFLLNEILTGLQVVGFVLVLSVGFLQVYLDSK